MTPDQISALAQFPIIGVLIFLLIRADTRLDKMIQTLVDISNRQSASVRRSDVNISPVPLQSTRTKE